MKKLLLLVLILTALLWKCAPVCAQDTATSGSDSPPTSAPASVRQTPPDPNRASAPEEAADPQTRDRERIEKQRQEMLRMREMRRARREKTGRTRDPNGLSARARDPNEQLKGLEEKVASEDQKHLERTAQLKRIRELALQGDSSESRRIIGRVDRLLRKEQRLYADKRQRLEMRVRMLKRMKAKRPNVRPSEDRRSDIGTGNTTARQPYRVGSKAQPQNNTVKENGSEAAEP